MKVAFTGASGNMGREALAQIMEMEDVTLARVLLTPRKGNDRLAKKLKRKYGSRVEIVRGELAQGGVCHKLVVGMDYVLHMAAVIPPASDASFSRSYKCNLAGSVALIDAIKRQKRQPKYVHVSTVALYGNRNELHPWGRVGDPLLVSPFDAYAMHKLYAERYCLEAGLEEWVVLRQTAMLHPNMMNDNISDGLMFHTALNAPLEWVSSRDSGYLMKRILERDGKGEVPHFWKNIYNIGAGAKGRETGYDTFNDGFAMIGGSTEKFFQPAWFSPRNFHGLWFADANELEELFSYQRDDVKGYWQEIASHHRIFTLGRFVPAKLIHFFLFRRLLKHPNSPRQWVKQGDAARVQAYFGGEEGVRALPASWAEQKLIAKGDFGDYDKMRADESAQAYALDHGFDDKKPIATWTVDDLRSAALFRGGECLAQEMTGAYDKVSWRCSEGHTFKMTPFTVLRGGHWCPKCCQPAPWKFDRLSKSVPFFAQVWYDSHDKEENFSYELDKENGAHAVKEDA